MSEFNDCISVECVASVICARCGHMETATDRTKVLAFRRLDLSLDSRGWRCYEGEAFCPACARNREDE